MTAAGPLRRFLATPAGLLGLGLLLPIALGALLGPYLYAADPSDMVAQPFLWPGSDAAFPLGTDSLGRDVAAGILHGARVSLTIGFAATVIGVTIGIVVGAAAGYFGGRVDDLLVRVIQIFHTMPSFVLLVVLVAVVQPSVTVVTVAIGLLAWPTLARLVRSEFRTLRERIIVSHILPNAMPPIIVASSVMAASAILSESALSFMGLGDPNVVSWGTIIGAGREFLRTAWFLAALPGLAIVLTVLSLNLIGDSLNDVLNPRLRGSPER
jgi:peptide/nickel transport system permease protein